VTLGMKRAGDIDAGLGHQLEFVSKAGGQSEGRTDLLLNLITPVYFRGINGRDAQLEASLKPAVDFLGTRIRVEQTPGAVSHAGEFEALGWEFDSIHDWLADLPMGEGKGIATQGDEEPHHAGAPIAARPRERQTATIVTIPPTNPTR
jgi:hypothetical protein